MKNPKIPFIIVILCIGQYINQGISDLPSQCLYYLTRESWHLTTSMLGFISFITAIAWYIKPFWGFIADKIDNVKLLLLSSYILLIILYIIIIIYGLNLYTLIITGIFINLCIGLADTTVDKEMVKAEQKYNLKSRLQSIQWIALGIAGLISSMG